MQPHLESSWLSRDLESHSRVVGGTRRDPPLPAARSAPARGSVCPRPTVRPALTALPLPRGHVAALGQAHMEEDVREADRHDFQLQSQHAGGEATPRAA